MTVFLHDTSQGGGDGGGVGWQGPEQTRVSAPTPYRRFHTPPSLPRRSTGSALRIFYDLEIYEGAGEAGGVFTVAADNFA